MASSRRPIIAVDGDGVTLDYHHGYRAAWHRAFGQLPAIRDPRAYWALDRYEVSHLSGDALDRFRRCFDEDHWSTLPPLPGAVDACNALHDAGFALICVTAIKAQFREARLRNLRACGFPIEQVVATPDTATGTSPKADALRDLKPVAFVDDYLPYLQGIPGEVHAALIMREPNGSPNTGPGLRHAHSQHVDLASFAAWWLGR